MAINLLRIAAFTDGLSGGNPAGVFIDEQHPEEEYMRQIAAEVGYSETVFAMPQRDAWRVRYFSPESEVPFCGHATIALGAALANRYGNDNYRLILNHAEISVAGASSAEQMSAALQSPPTHSKPMPADLLAELLTLFAYNTSDLDTRIPPACIHGGADHLLLCLNSRARLAAMQYQLENGRELMNRLGVITIMLAFAENSQRFHSRNPFASGGVYEDPATGAATAAFAGYLRDLDWPHQGSIEIIQGEDMGMRSLLQASFSATPASSIRVAGTARLLKS